ncbi:hypothetical protein PN499_24825 [Kamptonema animale CS-326]|jgi:hypothetical protein|uniref:DUF6745 domain-containing protein n=1 Tax=Kamptonema animale TaxID=92934 RepID=UPI0023313186|nr:hypothetical protein [Kamptonema animale]MDB9514428.1 hypothetical protein [Kamptonema animale CS-326]
MFVRCISKWVHLFFYRVFPGLAKFIADKFIEELTTQEIALIPIIRDGWIPIYLDTTPIDKQKAEAAICLAYECAEVEPPQQILWFDNPLDATNYVISTYTVRDDDGGYAFKGDDGSYALKDHFDCGYGVRDSVWEAVWGAVTDAVGDSILDDVSSDVREPAWDFVIGAVEDIGFYPAGNAVWNAIREFKRAKGRESIMDDEWVAFFGYFDVIGIDCSKVKGLLATAKHCGWWGAFKVAFKDVAVAIPKPSVIRLDDRGRLHGEGVPAVVYKGFNVYAYHGVRLPEKYGSIHPEKWQSQWLLEEDNAELKRVLIQGIGYDRICQELRAIELDSWQEYTLLRIDSNIDVEPIYLLKMTCPSTGYIHALRVPPDRATARDAITWVNWGIAPEEFAVQT